MDAFLESYIEAALWSSTDPDTEKPLDDDYCSEDLEPATLEKMRADCERFIELAGWMIAEGDAGKAGHDFWLTRNGHGCGFWDGDWEEHGEALTDVCDKFHNVDLYIYNGQVCAN